MMSTLTRWDSITIEKITPDGTMFVTVMEDEDGKPIAIRVSIGKAGTSLAAWANGLSAMLTTALEDGKSINHLIEQLSGITGGERHRNNGDGVVIRSGMEGIKVALMEYRKEKFRELKHTLGGEDDDYEYRPPRMGN